ncbi:MAG: hypothetical protein HN348_24645 [Proteobacteria bacterium]|jgi:hypothetical protein|nr:hypothetical protein [Pseudomonadota bacterium]
MHTVSTSTLFLLLAASGCSKTAENPDPTFDDSAQLFALDDIRLIEITIDEDDWDALRQQRRAGLDILNAGCVEEPVESPYTYFPADITIDGQTVENVGLRKKGFWGSVTSEKPSLKVKFHEYEKDQRFMSMKRLTLNNTFEDPSHIRECLGYAMYREAGITAPRCNFAEVTVNGEALGVYANIESIKKDFLTRNFDDDSGNLYEGQLSDFRDGWVGTFQPKTNKDDADYSDLDAVRIALEASNSNVYEELSTLIDMEDFTTFWAMEGLLRHNDSYSANANNYYVYVDPQSGLINFMPWGLDSIMANELPESPQPLSVYNNGALSHRLYDIPEYREDYFERLEELLDEVWVEDELLDTIDSYELLIAPYVQNPDEFEGAFEEVRAVVETARQDIGDELDQGEPEWSEPMPDPLCPTIVGDVLGSFNTTWESLDQEVEAGTGTLEAMVDSEELITGPAGAIAGLFVGDEDQPPWTLIQVSAPLSADDHLMLNLVVFDPDLITPNAIIPLDYGEAFGMLVEVLDDGQEENDLGLVLDGQIVFDNANTTEGGTISGTFESLVMRVGN